MLRALNELVDRVTRTLMAVDADNYVAASEQALTDVAAHFGLDVAFLRHNDHTIGATILIAQWPIRTYVPDPDPIGTVYFKDADPVFAMAEHVAEPVKACEFHLVKELAPLDDWLDCPGCDGCRSPLQRP